jgi:hypothetical protein
MTVLARYSEPYSPSGSVSAEGAKNALGRPKLSLPELLVREALQNSCDARDPSSDAPVTFSLRLGNLLPGHREALRESLLDRPSDGLPLHLSLQKDRLPALFIEDRGTVGLGGPTRADIAVPPGAPTDFVDFLRNIGTPPDKQFGSGSYGYGKSVLFRASAASTIVVYSRCRLHAGVQQSRLIATALGTGHVDDGVRMTGRHWWGSPDPVVGAEPLLDERADALASDLGFERMGETGTSIMVIDPALGLTHAEAGAQLLDAALLYAWPQLADVPGVPRLELSVSVDGAQLAVPDPARDQQLAGFVAALRKVHQSNSVPILCRKPKQVLGKVAFEAVSPAPLQDTRADDEDRGARRIFALGLNHVALMRRAHLVINYRSGPPHHVPGVAWSGVFVADDGVDDAFRDSEPPSHDEWNHELLPPGSRERTFVKMAKSRIDEAALDEVAPPVTFRPGGTGGEPLGRLADQLSDLVSPLDGPRVGGRDRPTGAGSSRASRRARVRISAHRYLESAHGSRLQIDFQVSHAPGSHTTVVDAAVALAVDEGAGGGPGPQPDHWIDPDGETRPPGPVHVENDGMWSLVVPLPDDASLLVDIRPAGEPT